MFAIVEVDPEVSRGLSLNNNFMIASVLMEMVSVEFCHILRSSFTASAVITNTGRRIARQNAIMSRELIVISTGR